MRLLLLSTFVTMHALSYAVHAILATEFEFLLCFSTSAFQAFPEGKICALAECSLLGAQGQVGDGWGCLKGVRRQELQKPQPPTRLSLSTATPCLL